jgi:hypothetical protein
MKKSLALATLLVTSIPATLLAHEGHGYIPASNPLHYVAEPVHVFVLLLAASAIGGVVYHFRRQPKKD